MSGLDFDPDALVAAFSSASTQFPHTSDKRKELLTVIREKKDTIQRKLERALSHISHKRNMKRLDVAEHALASVSARFEPQRKKSVETDTMSPLESSSEISMELDGLPEGDSFDIDELESRLASITLDTTSVKGKTLPVKEKREELIKKIDELADEFKEWRLSNDVSKPAEEPVFDMSE